MPSPELDKGRAADALAACKQEERAADDLEHEAHRLRAQAAARRVRWGLPPRHAERPEFPPRYVTNRTPSR